MFPPERLDPFEVVEQVAEYRDLWKPNKVRIVLLAESHVRTSPGDFAIQWSYKTNDSIYAGHYVRFVYCLANGERELAPIPTNRGTWQYWKLLYHCLNPVSKARDPPVLKRSTPDFHERMRKKIDLLLDLKNAGIWLMDASIVGIEREKPTLKAEVLLDCWKNYVGQKLTTMDPRPRGIIVVGNGVRDALEKEILNDLGIQPAVIRQPNAHLIGGYSDYQICFDFCSRL